MPLESPTAEQLWNGEIGFFSLDTDVIQSKGYRFGEPPLSQLPKQLPTSMTLQLSPVVLEEIINHRIKSVIEAESKLHSAIAALERSAGFEVAKISEPYQGDGLVLSARAKFEKEVKEYVDSCGGDVLDFESDTAERIFEMYFRHDPPFENNEKKKYEFPDATSLVLLEQYAHENFTQGLVVSRDKGWVRFCESSHALYCVESIEQLASLFVATSEIADNIKLKVLQALDNKSSLLRGEITEKLAEHFALSEWDVGEINAVNTDRVEASTGEASLVEYGVISQLTEVWSDEEDSSEWIIELSVDVKVKVPVYVEFYKWDWVDREDFHCGSDVLEVYEDVRTEVYITCGQVSMNSPPERWNIKVEVGSGCYELSEISAELDFYDR